METAGARQPDFVGSVEHAGRGAQQSACTVERQRLEERFRRQPAPATKQMMQLRRRNAGGVGDGFDLGLGAPVAADMSDGAADDVVILRGGRQFGELAEAAAERRLCAVRVGGVCVHAVYLNQSGGANHPLSETQGKRRASPGLSQSAAQRLGKIGLFVRPQETADGQLFAAAHQE